MKNKLKTSKSAKKRFKMTTKGKALHRSPNMNHFNAKDTGAERRNKRGQRSLKSQNFADIKNLLPYSK